MYGLAEAIEYGPRLESVRATPKAGQAILDEALRYALRDRVPPYRIGSAAELAALGYTFDEDEPKGNALYAWNVGLEVVPEALERGTLEWRLVLHDRFWR